MEFRLFVLGLLVLVAFDHVFGARPNVRAFRPRVLTLEPQRVYDQSRKQWKPIKAPHKVHSQRPKFNLRTLNLAPSSIQSKQEFQPPVSELAWKFPVAPEEPAQPDFNFELQQPKPSNSVAVQCWEDGVHVEVKQDFFGTGQLLEPTLISLGGCGVVDIDAAARVLHFHSALQECGSELVATEDELVYIFTLDYRPEAFQSTPIVRSSGVTIGIECHYPRRQNVSSSDLQPTWIPYMSTKVAEDVLHFSLKLMTDNWMSERLSDVFFLGDVINIQASVKQYNHVPLRVFVDHCVATAGPDVNSAPTYSFIENHGCLTDAKNTGSSSKFLPRVRDDQLQFQLEAFRFQQGSGGAVLQQIFIICLLRASAASSQIDEDHKACSFRTDGWVGSDGSDQVCGCCDTSCGLRTDGVFSDVLGFKWEGKAQVGPLHIWERQHQEKSLD